MNQCQLITFLILKSDNIGNSRIALKGIDFYPSTWYICDFFLFHIESEGKCGWTIGDRRVCCCPPSPLKLWGGEAGPSGPHFLRLCTSVVVR